MSGVCPDHPGEHVPSYSPGSHRLSVLLHGGVRCPRIHNFTEGRDYSLYDCLPQFGLDWFGRRSFFDQREETGQALWMDLALALARRSGQELNNSYVLTTSPVFGTLRKFFCAAVRDIQFAYDGCFGGTGRPPVNLQLYAAGYRREP